MTPAQSAYKQPFMDHMPNDMPSENPLAADSFANQQVRYPTGNSGISRSIDMEDWREDQPVARQEWSMQIDDLSLGGTPAYNPSVYSSSPDSQQLETPTDDPTSSFENDSFYSPLPMQSSYNPHSPLTTGARTQDNSQHFHQNLNSAHLNHPSSSFSPIMSSQNSSTSASSKTSNSYVPSSSLTGNGGTRFSPTPSPEKSWNEQTVTENEYEDSDQEYPDQELDQDTSSDTYESSVPQFLQDQTSASAEPPQKAYYSNNAGSKWRQLTYIAGGSLVLVIAVVLLWPASKKPTTGGIETLPLITAEATPIKIKAEPSSSGNPGAGDLQIYQGMNGTSFDPEAVEQLLPRGENPQNPGQVGQIDNPNNGNNLGNSTAANLGNNNSTNSNNGLVSGNNNNNNTGVSGNNSLAPLSLEIPPVKPTINVAGVSPNNNSTTVPPVNHVTPPAAGIYYAQIASVRTADGAQAAASKFQRDLGSVLGNVSISVKQVDLGADKGITYRVVAGPVSDRAAANNLCENIKSKKQDCFVATMP